MPIAKGLTPIQKRWWTRGFTCNEQKDPPRKRWAMHQHDWDEIVVPVSGQIEVQVGKSRRRPTVGREVVIKAGMPHAIRNPMGQTALYLYGFRNRSKKR